jgi:hypothetical protein
MHSVDNHARIYGKRSAQAGISLVQGMLYFVLRYLKQRGCKISDRIMIGRFGNNGTFNCMCVLGTVIYVYKCVSLDSSLCILIVQNLWESHTEYLILFREIGGEK